MSFYTTNFLIETVSMVHGYTLATEETEVGLLDLSSTTKCDQLHTEILTNLVTPKAAAKLEHYYHKTAFKCYHKGTWAPFIVLRDR